VIPRRSDEVEKAFVEPRYINFLKNNLMGH
jgi:hypothetical protein